MVKAQQLDISVRIAKAPSDMRFPLKARLALSFGTVLCLTGTVGFIGVQSLATTADQITQFANRPFQQTQALGALSTDLEKVRRILRSVMTTPAEAKQD